MSFFLILLQKAGISTLQKSPFIFLLFVSSCSLVKQTADQNESAYFVSVPIIEMTSAQIPCVNIQVEGKTLPVMLDLGFRGHVTMAAEMVDHIGLKTFLSEKTMYGIRGKKYQKKRYRIPELKIGKMTFSFPVLQEDNVEFLKDATFIDDPTKITHQDPGRLGWELFFLTPLLIDVQNSRIAFCDRFETLKKEGYPTETFIKAPLFLERGLVEFEAWTPKGPLRCMLDTGATWNILHDEASQIDGKKIWIPENKEEYPFFLIEGIDFGSITFHRMPIQIPVQVEAILGMEFFQTHRVFLDFKRQEVYISKM